MKRLDHPIPHSTLARMDDGDILTYANGRLLDEEDSTFELDEWRYYLKFIHQRQQQTKKPPPQTPAPPDKSAA